MVKSCANRISQSWHIITASTLAVLVLASGCTSDERQQRFQMHIDYLASDELEGRGTGSRGIELAAEYIARQFEEIGLEPAGDDGTFFQGFSITLHRKLTDAGHLTWESDTAQREQGVDFVPFGFSSNEAFSGEVVFCGYAAVASEENHDDFVHLDLTDKVALILRGEPPSWADEDGNHSRHAMFREKTYNAKDRGAVAVLIVNRAPEAGETDELMEFETEGADAYGIPAFHIKRAMAEAMLLGAGKPPLDKLQETLDSGGYASTVLSKISLSGQAGLEKSSATARNVLGMLRGDGPLAEEVVVVGAHYDHLGIRKPTMRKFRAGKLVKSTTEPEIHNGADDNASGTSGVIEIARMLASKPRPKRGVLFIAFAGEEAGLLGSKHYTEHPVIPTDQTVAMLNMDMIGRMDPRSNELQVFGANCGTGFSDLLRREARSLGLRILPSPDTGGRSDHAPFIRKGIPSMHFFTGFNSDYHKPTDDSNKINSKGGARVISLVSGMTWELALADERPEFVEVPREEKREAGGTPSYQVVMGLAPGYGDDGKPGMSVDGVTPEGPADFAGMKGGDRIIRIGGKKVDNVYDYMAATRNNQPGDKVEVVVSRDGREVVLQVTLASAR